MKRLVPYLIVLVCAVLPLAAHAQEPSAVTKTACMSALGFNDEARLKDALLIDAKRLVVNELFGELIAASTIVENMAVTRDQISASSMGFLRTQGDPLYFNGEDFAEVRVTLAGYVTAEDLALFKPVPLSHRLCASDPAQSAAELRDATRAEAVAQALNQYEPRLLARDRAQVLLLMKRVSYAGSGFLPDSDIFCAEVTGEVVPVEVLTFVGAWDEDSPEDASETATARPASTARSSLAPTATLDPARVPNATATAASATAVAYLSRTPTPAPTPTPTPDATATATFALSEALASAEVAGLADVIVTDTGIVTAVNPRDGATYVFVPAGEFTMGSPSGVGDSSERPQHTVTLDAFWLMQTEVTNAMYAACVQAGKCTEPDNEKWDDAEYTQHPVVNVDWSQAVTYAEWVGGRLPTEAEWEKACRGTDGRTYPWGNQPPTANLANSANNVGSIQPVGSYSAGASPYGALDMAGNVVEMTADWLSAYSYSDAPPLNPAGPSSGTNRVLRGMVRCTFRAGYVPDRGFSNFGFRVGVSGL